MNRVLAIGKRELRGYFATPVAYVFLAVFAALLGFLVFGLSGFFERGQADLMPFFQFHPFVFLFLVPAVSMRLWAEERRSGTLELLLTLPVSTTQAVLGKFLAAWAFLGIALIATFPAWLTVNFLGDPDNGVILAGYLGSLLMAGAYLAVGGCLSALTRNQVIAFVVSGLTLLFLVMLNFPAVLDFLPESLPQFLLDLVGTLGIYGHFDSISRGVVDLRDLIYFLSLIGACLFLNVLAVEWKKA